MNKSYRDGFPTRDLLPSIESIETQSPFGDWSAPPYIATAFEQAAYLRAKDPDTGAPTTSYYVGRAFDVVEDRLARAINSAPLELQENQEVWPSIKRLLQAGVYGDLFSQIQANVYRNEDETAFEDLRNGSDKRTRELLYMAANGVAMPIDVIELLLRKPQIGEMEVANQTAPLDWMAFREMDSIIDAAMFEVGFSSPSPQIPTYSVLRFDYNRDPRVALLLRRASIGTLMTYDGEMTLTQQDTFIADMTKMSPSARDEVQAWLHRGDTEQKMSGGRAVEYDGEHLHKALENCWSQTGDLSTIVPAVRSYRARIA
jgi:hypothetical protein